MNGSDEKNIGDQKQEIEKSHPTYAEISPNKRYIRFEELISQTGNIKFSFKAFDTRNGTEVVWQKICMSDLSETEQERISRSANYLKEVQNKHIMEYLAIWLTEEPRTLNLITTYLDSLKQFMGKITTLRWRIVKKWCRHILWGLTYLHGSEPQIIHRNLTWNNIFVNPGLGDLYIGGMWLSGILADSSDPISVSDALTKHYQGSAAYKAPEIMEKQPLTTKIDIYSFGICVLVMIIRREPYADCQGDIQRIGKRAARGVLPKELDSVENPIAVEFISSCLRVNPEERLSAEELLEHRFLQMGEDLDDDEVTVGPLLDTLDSSLSDDESDTLAESAELAKNRHRGGRDVDTAGGVSRGGYDGKNNSQTANKDPQEQHAIDHQDGASSSSPKHPKDSLPPLKDGGGTASSPHASSTALPTSTSASSSSPQDVSSVRSEVAPSVEPRQNRLDMELAALSKGEDVHQDKGIHDGRRSEKDSPDSRRSTSHKDPPSITNRASTPAASSSSASSSIAALSSSGAGLSVSNHIVKESAQSFSTMSPCGTPTTIRAVPQPPPASSPSASSPRSPHSRQEQVAVELRIAEGHTSDGIIKDVEFLFHIGQDDFNVVATEMKDELNLTLPTDQLAELIRLQVDSVIDNSNNTKGESENSITHSSLGEMESAPTLMSVSDTITTESDRELTVVATMENSPPSTQSPVKHASKSSTPDSTHPPPTGSLDTNLGQSPISNSDPPNGMSSTAAPTEEKKIQDTVRSDAEGNSLDGASIAVGAVAVAAGRSPSSSSLMSLEGGGGGVAAGLDEVPAVPPPGEDASTEEIQSYELYLKENEKIDKECRAAKRVFEQRIQKHKIIQETCEEDLLKAQEDYSNQCTQLDKSEAKAIRKKEEATKKIVAEHQEKLEQLKEARREKRATQRLQEKARLEMMAANPVMYTLGVPPSQDVLIHDGVYNTSSWSHLQPSQSNTM